jgi:hypothetical protein
MAETSMRTIIASRMTKTATMTRIKEIIIAFRMITGMDLTKTADLTMTTGLRMEAITITDHTPAAPTAEPHMVMAGALAEKIS